VQLSNPGVMSTRKRGVLEANKDFVHCDLSPNVSCSTLPFYQPSDGRLTLLFVAGLTLMRWPPMTISKPPFLKTPTAYRTELLPARMACNPDGCRISSVS